MGADRFEAEPVKRRGAELLNGAHRVAILAGQGAKNARAELLRTADLLGAPIVKALLVGGAASAIAGGVGMIFMTWLQSRFARINSAMLFIALLFFGWLWGVWGLLLGAPLIAISKVVCDRIEALKPIGELLGLDPPAKTKVLKL